MFKGNRGPLLAFILSLLLLGVVVITRPPDVPAPTQTRVSVTRTSSATITPVPPTLLPTSAVTPQSLDTATLTEGIVGCFKKLNPLLSGYNQPDRDAAALIFEGLTTTDSYGTAVPDLASSWTVSNDGLVYVFNLRTDVLWQDGIPFTSDDILFTIHLMQDAAFPGKADLHQFWDTVEVDALDKQTVRFKLAQPLAPFPDYVRIGILPEHALRGTPADKIDEHPFNLSPIGTGPYQFDGLLGNGDQLSGIRLKLAATYRARPEGKDGYALQQIIFRCEPSFLDAINAFTSGAVNSVSDGISGILNGLAPEVQKQISSMAQLQPYLAYRPAFGGVIFNWQRDEVNFFRDVRMRQALALSLDRGALVNKFLGGRAVPANGPILPNSWAYAPGVTCPNFDPGQPDLARTRLSQVQIFPAPTPGPLDATAAATVDPNETAPAGPTATRVFQFRFLVSNDADLEAMSTDIVTNWTALGIQVTKEVVDAQTFKGRLQAGNFDAALVELNLDPGADPDPYSLWRLSPDKGGLNFGGLNERRLSELVEQGRRATGPYRVDLYRQFQQLFCDREAAILLYYPVYYYRADRRIAGIQLGFMSDPSDRFRTIQNWQFTP